MANSLFNIDPNTLSLRIESTKHKHRLSLHDRHMPAGHVYVTISSKGAFLEEFYVCQDYRKQGVGKKLLEHVDNLDKIKSVAQTLLVYEDNDIAIHLYEGAGFVTKMVIPHFSGYEKNMLVMVKPAS